jgi:DNA-binding NarL/FixJ family response regulator
MPLRCLLVDDNASFLEIARLTLERDGLLIVGSATTGEEALCLVETLAPDLALVDVDLGQENGLDLVEPLLRAGDGLRVIMMSSYDESDFRELIASSPAVGFLPKTSLSARAIEQLLDSAESID